MKKITKKVVVYYVQAEIASLESRIVEQKSFIFAYPIKSSKVALRAIETQLDSSLERVVDVTDIKRKVVVYAMPVSDFIRLAEPDTQPDKENE